MTHQNQHQETAQKLITAYQGPEPLAAYLKKYFAANKKHGSKDRKSISAFCYAHFTGSYIKGNRYPYIHTFPYHPAFIIY
jgi:hypothetical protein